MRVDELTEEDRELLGPQIFQSPLKEYLETLEGQRELEIWLERAHSGATYSVEPPRRFDESDYVADYPWTCSWMFLCVVGPIVIVLGVIGIVVLLYWLGLASGGIGVGAGPGWTT